MHLKTIGDVRDFSSKFSNQFLICTDRQTTFQFSKISFHTVHLVQTVHILKPVYPLYTFCFMSEHENIFSVSLFLTLLLEASASPKQWSVLPCQSFQGLQWHLVANRAFWLFIYFSIYLGNILSKHVQWTCCLFVNFTKLYHQCRNEDVWIGIGGIGISEESPSFNHYRQ